MKGIPLEQVANFLGQVNSASISYYAKANPEVVRKVRMWKKPDLLKRLCGL